MESKIKIKLGGIEIEYEGSESFLKKELPDLIKIVTELYKSSKTPAPPDGDDDSGEGEKDEGSIKLSTKSIATKLSCASGPDLIIAAAAHLTLVKNTPVFARKTLLTEMKTATSFYKSSYSGNLSKSLTMLLREGLNEPSSGNYALTNKKLKEIRGKLA